MEYILKLPVFFSIIIAIITGFYVWMNEGDFSILAVKVSIMIVIAYGIGTIMKKTILVVLEQARIKPKPKRTKAEKEQNQS
jgi:hypothetical protein